MAQTTRPPHSGRERDNRPPPDEAVAAELAVEIVREVIEAGDLAPGTGIGVPTQPVPPSWASQIPGIVASQVNQLASLGAQQQGVLADLLRLHFSLQGPQVQLESGSNFSRPLYPSPVVASN
jgi:hypothetical protein